MSKKIKILHLEDIETDADLVHRVLKKGGIEAELRVVDNKEAYVAALIEFAPDVILSDHTLPSFNSREALNIFLQSGMKIPFILVTATISEEYAVSVIKAGADDYILKNHLERLPEAIINSLEKIESEISLENRKAMNIKEKTNAVLVAHELERSQMANELLENINQILAASNLYIDCAISEEDKRLIFMQNSKKYILMAIDEIKKLSHVIMPPTFEVIGLIDSLNNWITFKQQQNGMNLITEWKNFNDRVTNDKLQLTIYRIVQEQLNNTIKYSRAKNVYISLQQTSDAIELLIKDDGVGFDTSKNTKGVGLQNINTRAEIHNGTMLLESQPGKGCVLKIVFPL
ncbi:MAG: response regulator [Ferruginibacter sp.]|nr:response regulator [Ferruginibacter sp.]